MRQDKVRIGIDIGGTFTDFVLYFPGQSRIVTFKVLSTPENPAQAVLEGLRMLDRFFPVRRDLSKPLKIEPETLPLFGINIIHGSTVATNALLERKGAVTALVTTHGFSDVLQIARQNRPLLYDLNHRLPEPLVPADLRYGINERVAANGEIIQQLELDEIDRLLPELASRKVESIAVCFLFSFLYPDHEARIASRLRQAGYLVSVSSEILPEYREYERTSTTVINAYVSPVFSRYLGKLESTLRADFQGVTFNVMQSNGGVISIQEARQNAVRCILSGPSGGVVGSQFIAKSALKDSHLLKIITFDMGGTSTDVALIDETPVITTETSIGGFPLAIPVLDIRTIGSGGGSIAHIDLGGALRVGPQSAGANPGPACYGRFDPESDPGRLFPTVTDANLVLGRILAQNFLGGQMPLLPGRSEHVIRKLGEKISLSSIETALGIIAVVNTHMERLLRLISVERGHDPRDFTLLSFGGAGGLHAVDLARRLTIPQVLVPPYASTLSALGMLAADLVKDYSKTVMLPGDTPIDDLDSLFEPLVARARQDLLAEGISQELLQTHASLDMRYLGQSYELNIPFHRKKDPVPVFHQVHHQAYGYSHDEFPAGQVEIVNLRLRAVGTVPRPVLPFLQVTGSDPSQAIMDKREVFLESGETRLVPIISGEALHPGNLFKGPAIIVRSDTTIFLGNPDQVEVDPNLNLHITLVN